MMALVDGAVMFCSVMVFRNFVPAAFGLLGLSLSSAVIDLMTKLLDRGGRENERVENNSSGDAGALGEYKKNRNTDIL